MTFELIVSDLAVEVPEMLDGIAAGCLDRYVESIISVVDRLGG